MFRGDRISEGRAPDAIFAMTAGNRQRSRAATFFLSLCLHAVSLTALVSMDSLLQPRPSFQVRLPEQVIAESRDRIVWYPLQRDLPAVAPVEAPAAAASDARPRYRLPQTIAANDPNPASDRQMILGPAPEVEINKDIPAPNLLGWSAPRVSPLRFDLAGNLPQQPERQALDAEPAPDWNPARPEPIVTTQPQVRLRYLAREKQEMAPSQQALAGGQVPQVQATLPKGLDVAQLRKAEPLRYWMQEQSSASPAQSAIAAEAAPSVSTAAAPGVDIAAFQPRARLRYWMPEGQVSGPAQTTLPAEATPQVNATLARAEVLPGTRPKPLLRYRTAGDPAGAGVQEAPRRQALAAFSGAAIAQAAQQATGTELAAAAAMLTGTAAPRIAPPLSEPAQGLPGGLSTAGDQPNLAAVGVDPDATASARLPAGNRRGRFAGSPEGGPGGGDQAPAPPTSASVRMPNLSIAGTGLPETPAARSSAMQSSAGAAVPRAAQSETLDLMTRFRNPREYTPIPPPDLAGGSAVDPLANRDKPVYSLAINMPNITSYSGSWVIRFAELGSREQEQARAARQQREEAPAPERKLSAPNPRLKVDPKYIRAAAHEGVEGTVVLYAVIGMDGLVRGVRIMRSLDARLDESAVEAFSKWKFDPATSAGSPVDVEAVVEIPFQLAPPEREAGKLRF